MKDGEIVAAIVGAASECGYELYLSAQERGLPVSEWRLYDSVDAIAASTEDDFPLRVLGDADFTGVDVVFLCGGREQSSAELTRIARGGAVAIDVRHAFAGREDSVLMVPEVNADAADIAFQLRAVSCPVPGATALSIVLNPIEQAAVLRRVVVTCLESVAAAGREGVEELARQTAALLAGGDAAPRLWGERIAFNVVPQVGDEIATGATDAEWEIEQQTRRMLDLPDLLIAVNVVRVPTFFGQGFLLNVETEQPFDGEAARAVLGQAPGILLHEGASDHASSPALSVAIGSDATHVGRVRTDPTAPYCVSFWVAFDSQRKGQVVNAVQIAESLLRVLR